MLPSAAIHRPGGIQHHTVETSGLERLGDIPGGAWNIRGGTLAPAGPGVGISGLQGLKVGVDPLGRRHIPGDRGLDSARISSTGPARGSVCKPVCSFV